MNDAKTLLTRYQPRQVGKPTRPSSNSAVVRFSPCGKVLAAGDFDGHVRRWHVAGDTLTPMAPLTGHHGWVQALAFDPAGKLLYAGDSWGRLVAWPFLDEEPRPVWSLDKAHDGWIRKVAVSPDGKTLATVSVRRHRPHLGRRQGHEAPRMVCRPRRAFARLPPRRQVAGLRRPQRQHRPARARNRQAVRTFDARDMYRLDRIQDVGGVRCLAFDRTGTAPGRRLHADLRRHSSREPP